MTPYSGWEMPLVYKDTIVQSHLWCRSNASLFDVSHMGQVKVSGKDKIKFIEHVTVIDMNQVPEKMACYTLIPNEKGGLIDDTIITNQGETVDMVLNAGCFEKDIAYLSEVAKNFDVELKHITDHALIALQGPSAESTLSALAKNPEDVISMTFLNSRTISILGVECEVQRSGYTGEDGFEVAIPVHHAEKLTRALLQNENVKLSGLAARDSLRLEAGLSLYGNDIDETTTPKQAGLVWAISKRRRQEGGFVGSKVILDEINKVKPCPLRKVGIHVEGAPARQGTKIFDPETEKEIGVVTSGTFAPSLNRAIALAFVNESHMKVDTPLLTQVRGKFGKAVVTKTPFIQHKYKR